MEFHFKLNEKLIDLNKVIEIDDLKSEKSGKRMGNLNNKNRDNNAKANNFQNMSDELYQSEEEDTLVSLNGILANLEKRVPSSAGHSKNPPKDRKIINNINIHSIHNMNIHNITPDSHIFQNNPHKLVGGILEGIEGTYVNTRSRNENLADFSTYSHKNPLPAYGRADNKMGKGFFRTSGNIGWHENSTANKTKRFNFPQNTKFPKYLHQNVDGHDHAIITNLIGSVNRNIIGREKESSSGALTAHNDYGNEFLIQNPHLRTPDNKNILKTKNQNPHSNNKNIPSKFDFHQNSGKKNTGSKKYEGGSKNNEKILRKKEASMQSLNNSEISEQSHDSNKKKTEMLRQKRKEGSADREEDEFSELERMNSKKSKQSHEGVFSPIFTNALKNQKELQEMKEIKQMLIKQKTQEADTNSEDSPAFNLNKDIPAVCLLKKKLKLTVDQQPPPPQRVFRNDVRDKNTNLNGNVNVNGYAYANGYANPNGNANGNTQSHFHARDHPPRKRSANPSSRNTSRNTPHRSLSANSSIDCPSDCNMTVIENDCENDYELIFASLNTMMK